MPPRKDDAPKTRKARNTSKDFSAFLIVLPLVDNDVAKAQAIVAKMREQKIF